MKQKNEKESLIAAFQIKFYLRSFDFQITR